MFWDKRKKEADAILKYMESAFAKNGGDIDRLERKLEEQLEDGRKLLKRQSGTMEDILEELQNREQETEEAKQQFRDMKKREEALMELCCTLLGQREMIAQQLLAEGVLTQEARQGWKQQLEIMEQETEALERGCTIQSIGRCGEKADYSSHEILAVYDARQGQANGTVAQVFSSGYCYNGKIMKKAQVAVYRREE